MVAIDIRPREMQLAGSVEGNRVIVCRAIGKMVRPFR
jgi:hypothetical protein